MSAGNESGSTSWLGARRLRWAAAMLLCAAGCVVAPPDREGALADLREPVALAEAIGLPVPDGGYTGIEVGDARQTLDAVLGGEAAGVEVVRVVENSPGDAAGIRVGDVLVEARVGEAPPRALERPSAWRAVEADAEAGRELLVVAERDGRRVPVAIEVARRFDGDGGAALQETRRVGVAVRADADAPGGALVVGLARTSPWRAAGLRYGDRVTAVDGRPVERPEAVLEAIAAAGDRMRIDYVRDGEPGSVEAALDPRAGERRTFWVPLLVDHEADRQRADTSVLLGLFRYEETRAAWRVRLLWLIWFGGGADDRLVERDG